MASQASPASYNDSMGKEIFLPRPPPSFDCDFEEGDERSSHDTDENWLPDFNDMISGNFHVMIDMTGDLDSAVCHHLHTHPRSSWGTNFGGAQDDAESSSRYQQSDLGTDPATANPTRPQSSLCGERPPWACPPPKAVNSIDLEQPEIPESSGAIQVCPAISVPSCRHSDGDGGGGSAAATAITEAIAADTEEDSSVEEQQDQEKEEQEREGTNNDGSSFPPSRQPEALIPASTVQVLESSLISQRRSPEVVQGYRTQTQAASSIMLPVREVACTDSGSCISIQDITFLRVKGQREAAYGPEYQFVAKMWLRPGAGIPSDLLHVYRRDVARQARLATLRTRKRMSEEAGVVKVKRRAAREKVKQAQV
jgi:hypothetical protein